MEITMTPDDYMDYLECVYHKIHLEKDYLTKLDAATGDGDHGVNMDIGFEALVKARSELVALPLAELFQRIGMILMSVIGGSGGVLYGSAYIEVSKALPDTSQLNQRELATMWDAMVRGIMTRGNAQPGMKTMVDTLWPCAQSYKRSLLAKTDPRVALLNAKNAAKQGRESTLNMAAERGRAYYQAGRGVGHLDPGAVSMYYTIEVLVDYLLDRMEPFHESTAPQQTQWNRS